LEARHSGAACDGRILTLPPQEAAHRREEPCPSAEHRRKVAQSGSCGLKDPLTELEPRRGEGCRVPSPLRGSRAAAPGAPTARAVGYPPTPLRGYQSGNRCPFSGAVPGCAACDPFVPSASGRNRLVDFKPVGSAELRSWVSFSRGDAEARRCSGWVLCVSASLRENAFSVPSSAGCRRLRVRNL